MPSDLTPLGKHLRKIRAELNWTQERVANLMGVSGPFLCAVETGKRPAPARFVDLAAQALCLDAAGRAALQASADLSLDKASIPLIDQAPRVRRAIALLARQLEAGPLSDAQAERLIDAIESLACAGQAENEEAQPC